MSDIAIKFENISKQYRLGLVSTKTLSHDLNRWWQTSVLRKEDPYLKIGESNDRSKKGESDYVWALKDIDFEVKKGEVLGIIGKNGAGKSTLLKILSKVTAPTTGTIKAQGRIASLLEVGTGFHPELTGRENIYMNGSIMGMNRREINRKLEEIVEFAGVARYIDTPTKRYSSGMTVRLGFSIAAHLEPEILVVDEVLAVGDAEFQKKAIGKMQDVSRGEGRTVLFVSHNMGAVEQLCNSALIIEQGRIQFPMNNVHSIIELYLSKNYSNRYLSPKTLISGSIFLITSYTRNETNEKSSFNTDENIFLDMEIAYRDIDLKNVEIGLALIDKYERKVFRSSYNLTFNKNKERVDLSVRLPYNIIAPGKYSFMINIRIPRNHSFEFISGISPFEISSFKSKYSNLTYDIGILNCECEWTRK